jgi:nitrous oxidase accessory protein NosD
MGRGIASGMHGVMVLMLVLVVPGALALTRDVHTFLELQTAIVVPQVDTINVMTAIEFKGEITVNRAVTLHGYTVARVVLDATNTNRHFRVGPDANVVFSNLHFTNV